MSTKKPAQEQELDARERSLEEREEALELNLKNLNISKKVMRDFDATGVASGNPLTLNEIGKGKGVEMVTDYNKKLSLEQFMNDLVTINVYPDGMQGALDVIVVTVNGVNQPIIRGKDQVIKRKYVEALARSRVTNYTQVVANASRPESIEMKPIAALTYPFIVREDRNPKGPAWLDAILKQPM